ncbi:MAG TPA: cell cycle transcriptional regulator TrcR [Alphaproteobacteria bacterium]|nr:cell cycle transcriptional regulator TrcR [Alphaproteobacteria bacterium]
MATLLMPKATAVWLVENTTLTFTQIAAFCGLHELEVQAIADGEVAGGMQGLDPVASGQLEKAEIGKGEADPDYRLKIAVPSIPLPEARTKGARYTPVAKRSDRPDAIAWLLKNHPELSDAQISKLVGTTKSTIQAVRDRTHWNTPNIKPQSPVLLGLCTHDDLEKAVNKARERIRRAEAETEKRAAAAARAAAKTVDATPGDAGNLGAGETPAPEAPAPEAPAGDAPAGETSQPTGDVKTEDAKTEPVEQG